MLIQYVGEPVTNILGQAATPAQRHRPRAELGLERAAPSRSMRACAGETKQRRRILCRDQPAHASRTAGVD